MGNKTVLINEGFADDMRERRYSPTPGEESDYIYYLKLKLRNTTEELEAFLNGNKYKSQQREYESIIRQKDLENKKLKKELRKAHDEIRHVRKIWSEAIEDVYKDCSQEVKAALDKLKQVEEHAFKVEKELDEAKNKLSDIRTRYYEQGAELEQEKETNKKLTARLNKDFTNSSLPSSQQGPGRRKIPNGRKPSGLKRGGQRGHEGHRLQQQTPTETHVLPDPEEYLNNPDYCKTGETVTRQKIFLRISVDVVEFKASVFRHIKTGTRVHAAFPPGYETDISYDGSVKAAAFLLNNECNVSLCKTKKFLSEISKGGINMSEATISGLTREFSRKTESEKKDITAKLLRSPVLNADFTNANVDGKSKQVLILASPSENVAMYYARDSKGHKGIKGTPLGIYLGTVVHDHDITFYSYGTKHQECSQHNCRYLTGSEQNEPDYTWNKKMHTLIQRMLHYRKRLGDAPLDPVDVAKMEQEYDEILDLAEKEYIDYPPGDGYRDGYNTYKRLKEFKESELLFLHDKSVPPDNSFAERLARNFKRKQKQVMVFRSGEVFILVCEALGVLYSIKREDGNVYQRVVGILRRVVPTKRKPIVTKVHRTA